MESDYLVVFCTCPLDAADGLADMLLTRRLAACVTRVQAMESRYWWQGEIHHATETLLVIKTRRDRFSALDAAVLELHPYDVPELIALSITDGSKNYLRWINESLNPDHDQE